MKCLPSNLKLTGSKARQNARVMLALFSVRHGQPPTVRQVRVKTVQPLVRHKSAAENFVNEVRLAAECGPDVIDRAQAQNSSAVGFRLEIRLSQSPDEPGRPHLGVDPLLPKAGPPPTRANLPTAPAQVSRGPWRCGR